MKQENHKEHIYYDEMNVPLKIRIVSERLCLDHTFDPHATNSCIGYEDVIALQKSGLIDKLFIYLDTCSAYYIVDVSGKKTAVFCGAGWINARDFEICPAQYSDSSISFGNQ